MPNTDLVDKCNKFLENMKIIHTKNLGIEMLNENNTDFSAFYREVKDTVLGVEKQKAYIIQFCELADKLKKIPKDDVEKIKNFFLSGTAVHYIKYADGLKKISAWERDPILSFKKIFDQYYEAVKSGKCTNTLQEEYDSGYGSSMSLIERLYKRHKSKIDEYKNDKKNSPIISSLKIVKTNLQSTDKKDKKQGLGQSLLDASRAFSKNKSNKDFLLVSKKLKDASDLVQEFE